MVFNFFKSFMDFLKEYKIVSLGIAFISGIAVNDLIKSFVNDIVMPVILPLNSYGQWENIVLSIGVVELRIGSFLSALINFVLLMVIVFIIVNFLNIKNKK
ncbi:large conductance mechanosensitive channel protein MscL [archaeon CG_4_10_14_0_2_um_filter_Archaea_38_6]|nr:MAG: large conductance mechanosensitive channel protein MscL [archaeon CG07_land_8_20_14_0_80_38_8]PIU89553.1 MAG: large conductance mechanosensitive channel protein MscL [archaeon CG06_land_8_20_14_3_00_37_11]PIX43629.1 MAG: large conductance mechanosensitive channel protein MscL [archaeon CG_4_8_14_3_um_filter_38_5]PJA21916.1 MAG: large conductance mechanosensitive channel protein MscL [archaeon CG_4_10_14_0_2_um_filter_Archaea_38_6]